MRQRFFIYGICKHFAPALQMQHHFRNVEVDQKRGSVHNGGDQRGGHDGGVHFQFLGNHRQDAADELGKQHGANQRQANHQRHAEPHTVQQHELCEITNRQRASAQQRRSALPPKDARQIPWCDVTRCHSADDG